MTDFTISTKAENVWLESWLDLSPEEQQEMDHVEFDKQTDTRFFIIRTVFMTLPTSCAMTAFRTGTRATH